MPATGETRVDAYHQLPSPFPSPSTDCSRMVSTRESEPSAMKTQKVKKAARPASGACEMPRGCGREVDETWPRAG